MSKSGSNNKVETSFMRDNHHREETIPEFSQRTQALMDQDCWQGVDRVGVDFPERAEVIELEPPDTTIVFKRKAGL